jgi:hypothetical protein
MRHSLTMASVVFALSFFGGSRVSAQGPGPAGLRPLASVPVRSITSRRSAPAIPASRSGMSGGERGALIGALVGLAAGVGFTVAYNNSKWRDGHITVGEGLLIGVILAVPLAVIGGLIGNAAR